MRAICSGLIGVCLLTLPSVAQVGTAGLTGKVKDITGAGVSGTQAELLSETVSDRRFRTSADSTGVYHFSGLPTDAYTLKLLSPGFKSLTVKAIHILESEQKSVPTLQLQVGSVADCGGHAVLDYIRFLPSGDHFGHLVGSIRIEQAPFAVKSPPIAGADVTLICGTGKVCGATKTNADGVFMFRTLPPGNLSVRVNRPGFYPLIEPGYAIEEGLESVYWSIYIERCPLGSCDPRLRPKKPPGTCE
jgi:Carboxypeptidase regulatory-like domain